MKNISKLYYKDYFKDFNWEYVFDKSEKNSENEKIIKNNNEVLLSAPLEPIIPLDIVSNTFELQVLYPGLITGIGMDHGSKTVGEFKLGMHFNYTYGMPVIYGSTIKGVLRSHFPNPKLDSDEIMLLKTDNINSYWEKTSHLSIESTIKLADNIFDGYDQKKEKLSIYKRDVFFDATISKPYEGVGNNKSLFLEKDSITPHGDNPLKDPKPITFLKIAAGVTLKFNFLLHGLEIEELEISTRMKEQLFKGLLCDFGVGAKTNVGYGQLEEVLNKS